jgi:glycosyltransferase involved in cell wall biosynthesis
MKILFNTNSRDSAAARVCVNDLSKLFEKRGFFVKHNDWEYSDNYDLILFMSKDSEVDIARKKSPDSLVGIIDPKLRNYKIEEAKKADFIIVTSIEQREMFLKYNKNIFIYFMFPNIEKIDKKHTQKEKILIGYHGNKIHLNNFKPHLNKALDKLSEKYDVELNAMYNIDTLGKWNKNLPKKIRVNHIQWSEKNYYEELAKCDIGIVPNLLSIKNEVGLFVTKLFSGDKNLALMNNDYITRYKHSTNPGRIYIFNQLGIPVISDFVPSASQFIQDGKSGFIVNGWLGWYTALEKLIKNHELRQEMSQNLNEFIENNYSIEKNFQNFLEFIKKLKNENNQKNNKKY